MSECNHVWTEPVQMKCMCGAHNKWMRTCTTCWTYQQKQGEEWVADEGMNKAVAEMRAKLGQG